jgi:hypothetical protein
MRSNDVETTNPTTDTVLSRVLHDRQEHMNLYFYFSVYLINEYKYSNIYDINICNISICVIDMHIHIHI